MNKTITHPADLAAFQHRVPTGLKAPGQPVLMIDRDGSILLLRDGANMAGFPDATYWTREPVLPPRPELPTAIGSVITNVRTQDGDLHPVAFRVDSDSLPWSAPDEEGNRLWVRDDDIASFDHARIVPNGVGVLDEEDKSPVVDGNGYEWEWVPEAELWKCKRPVTTRGTKRLIDHHFGPLRPASEKDGS